MDWNEYFIEIAKVVAKKSKDESTKVGTVIVDKDNRPVSFGYNGFVAGCDETLMTQARPLKYELVCHSEISAILFAHRSLVGCKLYTTQSPCPNCLKYILQAGIREIYYASDSIMMERGTPLQAEAIIRLLGSIKDVKCINLSTLMYYEYSLMDKFQLSGGGM